jgi:ketosteroid isomerase-like protein
MVERLCRATNSRDLDALVACFADDYRNETPMHPERGFTGREQVLGKGWQEIFSVIGDVHAEVLRVAVDGDTVWSEWEHRGTRPDGSAHVMRGVVIFGVTGGVARGRFYPRAGARGRGRRGDTFRRRQPGSWSRRVILVAGGPAGLGTLLVGRLVGRGEPVRVLTRARHAPRTSPPTSSG